MNLLKAIGKTTLSLLKWLLIFSLIIGCIIGFAYLLQIPGTKDLIVYGLMGILLLLLVLVIGWSIQISIKENYETYTRKTTNPDNEYRIYYNIVYERDTFVFGKTKQQALENLYSKTDEGRNDVDCSYKIIKIKQII